MVSGQPLRIEGDAKLAPAPADERGFGNILDLLDGLLKFCGNPPQLVPVVPLAPQGQS